MACIIRDKSFNQIVDILDIHPDSLEEIIKEWRKDIKARQDAFPSIDYIREQISAKDNFVEDHLFEKATKIWQEKFSQPAIFDSREDAETYREEANKFFVQDASYIKRTKDGKYEVTVSEPQETIESIEKEMQSIKDAAEKNGTFMKAPNGKDTNLKEERQWLQVRTKRFKNWFGDWTKQFVVYQGRKSNKDGRKFNYYTIDKNEASRYGNNLESKTIDTTGMLSYFSNEYTKLSQEFYEKTGKRFDILDNSKEGLQTQNEFFEFVQSEGYTGFESLSEHPHLGKDFIENPYIVEFDNHKDSELISKVVDENGEPLVVYHGTDNKFDVFSNLFSIYTSNNEKMSDSYRYNEDSIEEDLYDFEEKEESYGLERDGARERFIGIITNSIHDVSDYLMDKMITDVEDFIEKKHPEYYLDMYGMLRKKLIESGELENIAEEYAEFKRPRDVRKYYERKLGITMRLFLNIKNPLIVDAGGSHWDSILFDGKKVTTRELEHFAENSGSDGFIVRNVKDYGEYITSSFEDIPGYIYVAFNSNQAKSAADNIGTFSTEDNNIYHEGEGTPKLGERDTRLQELWDKNKTEETKITELLSLIDENSEFSGIIDLLKTKKDGRKSLLSDVKVKVVDTDVIKTRKNDFGGRRAYYNASEKTIYIDSSAQYINGNADSVILHEVMHAITVNRILGNSKFRAEFDKIIDEYNKNFRNYRYRKTTIAGKENSHYMEEFIADVWSNRNTIENLKSIKTNDNLTLWDKIKNFFTRIFTGSNGTLMAKASDAIYRLLDEPEITNSKDNYYEEDKFVDSNSDAEERNVPQAIRKTNEGYVKQSAKFNREVDNLLDGTLVSPLEVRDVAVQVAYKIHDIIGDLIDNPDKIFTEEKFSKQDEKNIEEAKKRIAGMSHKELVQYIGARNLLNYVRAQMFELPQGNWTFDMLDQADLYAANFDALIKIGMSTFSQIEGFGIVSNLATQESMNKNGVEDFSVIDDIGIDADDLTSSIDYDAILDEIGNIQEHWQIESRTIDVLNSATALVKDALGKCYIVRAVDTVDENGNKVRNYERVKSKWGVELRMTPRDATSSILRWARGSMNINDMIAKLKEKEDSNPWIHQIIEKLEDKSGDQTQFQSQFFKVFEKHFQIYSVVSWDNEKKKYVSKIVNERPALKEARDLIRNGYESGSSPIFTDKKVNTRALKELEDIYKDALKYRDARWDDIDDETREVLSNAISVFVNEFGYYISPELTLSSLNGNNFKNIVNTMGFIVANLKEGASLESKGKQYNPFKFGENYSISGNIKQLLSPLTEALEDTAITSFYDNGKMYQSYVTPSFLSKMFIQFGSDDASFKEFISKEYAGEDWFRDQSKDESVASSWRNVWLQVLSGMSEQERKEIFSHKVQLNFNRKSYMRGMSDTEYIMSFISEYFSAGKILDRDVAWYRIPIMSNKPSAEFIRFIRYSGPEYKSEIISGMKKIFNQEISRIQTVKMMEEQGSEVKISNLNEKGKDFQFLSFLNEERRNKTELGNLIDKKINGEATASDESRIDRLLSGYTDENGNFIIGAIQKGMDAKADEIIKEWRRIGIFDNLDSIEGINSGFANKEEAIRNFIWNDTFAAMNILQLTITDMALYSSAEDIQKRLAQLHSPGLMANEFATDFNGNSVSGDGTIKSIVLDDFEGVKSNIIENLSIVFDRKIKAARARGNEQEAKGWEVTKDSIIKQFEDINVTDGQAFKSISAARKNAFMFGTWTRENEALFNKLKNPEKYGEYTYQDVKNAFTQPRKPFAYGMISKQLDVENAPLSSIRKGVQYKNSEYLLILADAILKDEDTGMPNMLKVIADFMEMTYDKFGYDGIDTVMFKSCVKTGIGNTLNLNQFLGMNSKEGYDAAYKYLVDNVIVDGKYNDLYVDRLQIRDYSEQQDIPEHFKEHFQAFGSQLRYIIPSDLEVSDDNGNPVRYSFNDNGVTKELDAKQFREEYEETISQNIEEDIAHLQRELGLGDYYISKADRNVAISKILQREILNNPSRYGIDMLQACSVDENGNFRIPLNDPIQSKRIEQLLNSVIKKMVNKQEIAGGPVVQVSNFGTSRRLSIVFKDKAGNEIRKNDYKPEEHDGKSFEEWLAENQDGIAYYEAFAPIYSDELLKFCDKSGFINIEAIERVNPDLLKMIGYRIPSEDKYSVMPIKIVGFLPREAGDALMLPYEITTITGADFDIDKIYLVRKQIELTRGLEQAIKDELKPNKKDEESIKAYLKERGKRLRAHLSSVLPEDILTQEEKDEIARKIDEEDIIYKDKDGKEVRRKSINQRLLDVGEIHSKNVDRINEIYNKKSDENESKNQSEEKYNKRQDSLDRQLDEKIAEEQAEYEQRIKDIQTERARRYTKELEIANKNKKYERITEFLKGDIFAKSEDPIQNLLRDKYLEFRYGTTVKSEGRAYRDNKIFDMSWATLTHATTTDKILNPGGFDPQKRVGYAVTAYKLGAKKSDGTPYTLDELEQMSSSELKKLCYRDKNIVFIDTHAQFYKQNSAAGQILGIFAVAKTAHTALEGYGYAIDIDSSLDLNGNKISIFGRTFGGLVDIDKKINFSGERISKILGSLVASAADAVKDPVLNLMNINADTVNVLNIAIRMGIPFEDIAHILSTKTISDALEEYNKRKLNDGSVTLNSVISEKIKKFEKDDKIKYRVQGQTYYSKLYTEDLSKEEVEKAIAGNATRESEYKILKAYERFSKIANEARGLDFCTRFNSIANAMGPLVVDNIAKEYKFNHFGDNVYKKTEGFSFNGQLVGIGDVINIDGKTIVVDDNTLPQLINSEIISRTPTRTRKITQYDVLEDHPILNSFSKTIDLAGELMSDSPLYSQNFRTTLAFFGENLTRRLMSKDYRKELSSFGDFYQSAMLIESGAIRMDELKYLIEQFPKDFFGKTKVKERYKNNTLIQAIQPDVINLADGKTRTVLSIKTTGLDNIQKEALMMGWAELEKVNPKLSRLLFKYAFFKGGIGFSPKSFMNLAPVPVKTAFKEYVDTFVNGQEVVPEEVVVNFIRNNANNRKLVPVIKEPKFRKSGAYYVTSDYSASRLDFFKISDSQSSVIFRKVMTDLNNNSYYEAIKPLGNNGEYFEYSKSPINEDAINSETEQNNGIENVADETPVVESVDNSDFDAASALRLLFTDRTIEAHKNYSQEKKDATREQYINYIDNNLKKKGLELNREQLEEVYKIFC